MTGAISMDMSSTHELNPSPKPGPPPGGTGSSNPLRKIAVIAAIAVCLVLSVIGGLLPILQGWIFFVIALYLLATEFVVGRRMVTSARRRWPYLSRQIRAAAGHRWAPRHLQEFDELTDPAR
jgi:quinol-cytochrome oxidoreductase complex cytochrome b subunit